MRLNGWILSFALVVAMMAIGCEKQEGTPADTTPPAPAGTAGPSAPATPSDDAAAPAAPSIPTPDHTPATAAAGASAADATAQAQTLLDQAMTYIKENKLELAEKTLTQLEGMKASLPAAMQTRIADARSLLNTAKAAGGAKLPALPGASQ